MPLTSISASVSSELLTVFSVWALTSTSTSVSSTQVPLELVLAILQPTLTSTSGASTDKC